MSFQNRNEFVNAQSSEKIILAHLEGTRRLINWINESGNTYSKITPYFVVGVSNGTAPLTEVTSSGAVTTNTWFYDTLESKLYINVADADPFDAEVIATYRFFYSNAPVTASYDLEDTGAQVRYQGRIRQAPGFKHKIGVEQKLISVIGEGKLSLENTDGGLDNIYDQMFFENKEVRIYSWTRSLNFSDAKIMFRGRVSNKKYTENEVTLTVKDLLYDLLQNVPQDAYTSADNVNDNIQGRYKRWVYGRVDGLMLQSIDQLGDGFQLTGTIAGDTTTETLTGTGTSFLSEVSPGDTLTIGTQEFSVSSVTSDTSLVADDKPEFAFNVLTAINSPEVPTTNRNRDFLVTGHACAQLSTTVSEVIQLNRVRLASTTGIESGDFLTFTTSERIEVKNVAPGGIVVLRQNMVLLPSVSSTVTREPIQSIYVEGRKVTPDNFTISNTSGGCSITLDTDVEFNIARSVSLGVDLGFTNGSRTVTGPSGEDLREILKPRDWVRPSDLSYTTYYEVLSVDEESLQLRINFSEATHTGAATGKLPSYISDDTIISADVLGRTEDNTPEGTWIETAPAAIQDMLAQIGSTNINTASFTQGRIDSKATISIAIPNSPSGNQETTKSVIDKLTRSVVAAVTLDNNLRIKYQTMLPQIDVDATVVRDEDIISYSIISTNGDIIRNSLVRYHHQDVDRSTLEPGYRVLTHSLEFVEKYIGTNKTDEFDLYLYKDRDARIVSHRYPYIRSLGRADIKLVADLRFENVEIGDQLVLDLQRLYTRFGDDNVRKKVCVVVGREVDGEGMVLHLTDFGNIYNRSSIITPNDAPDFTSSTTDERILYGYITDSRGIIDDDEKSANINLIS